jgi:NAD+ diphosphatase
VDLPPPSVYAGGTLDRAANRRHDDAFIAACLADPAARFIPVWRGRHRIATAPDGTPCADRLPAHRLPQGWTGEPWALLGLEPGGAPLLAIELGRWDQPDPDAWTGLREVALALPAQEAALLAQARGLMLWRTRARFCGACGAACTPRAAGHAMRCTGCGTEHFPRLDPTVIMRVTHAGRILLGRPTRLASTGIRTVLAGFVEAGETLEEAVAREVAEEAGIPIGPPRYLGSQPWPFPASLMLGFAAEALSDTLTVDPEELLDAAWYSREAVLDPAAHDLVLPPAFSIARRLIDGWAHAAA